MARERPLSKTFVWRTKATGKRVLGERSFGFFLTLQTAEQVFLLTSYSHI